MHASTLLAHLCWHACLSTPSSQTDDTAQVLITTTEATSSLHAMSCAKPRPSVPKGAMDIIYIACGGGGGGHSNFWVVSCECQAHGADIHMHQPKVVRDHIHVKASLTNRHLALPAHLQPGACAKLPIWLKGFPQTR